MSDRKAQVQKRSVMGFTIIEVMIVIIVVSVLAAIALPSYQQSRIKSQRMTGKGVLYDVIARQEQFFINNKAYATALTELGYSGTLYINPQAEFSSTADGAIYKIELTSIASVDAVRAVPQGLQTRDSCGNISLTVTGAKAPTTSGCW